MAYIPSNYKNLESDYRDKALKLFPWVCGKCAREFVYSNLKEPYVHHMANISHRLRSSMLFSVIISLMTLYCQLNHDRTFHNPKFQDRESLPH